MGHNRVVGIKPKQLWLAVQSTVLVKVGTLIQRTIKRSKYMSSPFSCISQIQHFKSREQGRSPL